MNNKIINLKTYKKSQSKFKMFFLAIVIGLVGGLLMWNYFVENIATLDIKIPASNNISYNNKPAIAMTSAQISNEFALHENKPILLYIYTTWCRVCKKTTPIINEISREFQATNLQVLAIAIDRGIDEESLKEYLNSQGNIYFQIRFLSFKEGFLEFLKSKNINYKNRIPFTVLIDKNGEIITSYSGSKSKNYLRNKIIKQFQK
jgi:thiol-disulfide isomerase/thioredoxin